MDSPEPGTEFLAVDEFLSNQMFKITVRRLSQIYVYGQRLTKVEAYIKTRDGLGTGKVTLEYHGDLMAGAPALPAPTQAEPSPSLPAPPLTIEATATPLQLEDDHG